jgi:hypothetical protein
LITAVLAIVLLMLRATSTVDNKDMLFFDLLSAGGFWAAFLFIFKQLPETSLPILASITSPGIALLLAAMGGVATVIFMIVFRLVFRLLYSIL